MSGHHDDHEYDAAGSPVVGDRFREALVQAHDLHNDQYRKGTRVPYLSHLMSVAALVLEAGHGEEDAIAALLHDALEDRGYRITADHIEGRYGRRVRELVVACTDTPADHAGGKKPHWKARKERYIDHVAGGSVANHISIADKVHNARSILRDLQQAGESVWDRFASAKEGTLWYYRSLVDAFRHAGMTGYLMEELDRTVSEIERLAQHAAPPRTRKYAAVPAV